MTTDNTDALRIVAKFVGAHNSSLDVCEFGERCDDFIEEARAVLVASSQAPAAQQAAEFERGRQLGMQQERALWELSASSQEIERAAQQEPQEPVAWRFDGMEGTGAKPIWHYSEARPAVSAFAVQPLYVATQRAVKPLTDEQIKLGFISGRDALRALGKLGDPGFNFGVRFAERAHGITARAATGEKT